MENDANRPLLDRLTSSTTSAGNFKRSQQSPDTSVNKKQSEGAIVHPDSLAGALRPALLTAQLFAIFPVKNAASAVLPTFEWCSLRVLYSLFIIICNCVVFILAVNHVRAVGVQTMTSEGLLVTIIILSNMLLYFRLATRWPSLAQTWTENEALMYQYGYPKHLRRKSLIIRVAVLVCSTVETVLNRMTVAVKVWPCYIEEGLAGWFRAFSVYNVPMAFYALHYSHWKSIALITLTFYGFVVYNFTDLFIMLISVALAKRFKLLNEHLRSLQGQNLPSSTWRQLRQTYNSLATLTRTVDSCINNIVLISFATNVCAISIQMLQGLRSNRESYEYAFYTFSLGYLIGRTCAMMIWAASVYDQSREPKNVLYAVPPESYCNEVERFLAQVTTDEVVLTGGRFFAVTRSLLLAIAGTVATYEIVLMQFQVAASANRGFRPGSVTNTSIGDSLISNSTRQCQQIISAVLH